MESSCVYPVYANASMMDVRAALRAGMAALIAATRAAAANVSSTVTGVMESVLKVRNAACECAARKSETQALSRNASGNSANQADQKGFTENHLENL